MNYTIVGLFPAQENIQKVSTGLEESGITNQNLLIYKTARKRVQNRATGFWEKLFLESAPEYTPDNDELITSVQVHNEAEFETVQRSFQQNKAVKIYEFKDMTIAEARDLNYIRKIVQVRAKSQIYALPQISLTAGMLNEL